MKKIRPAADCTKKGQAPCDMLGLWGEARPAGGKGVRVMASLPLVR